MTPENLSLPQLQPERATIERFDHINTFPNVFTMARYQPIRLKCASSFRDLESLLLDKARTSESPHGTRRAKKKKRNPVVCIEMVLQHQTSTPAHAHAHGHLEMGHGGLQLHDLSLRATDQGAKSDQIRQKINDESYILSSDMDVALAPRIENGEGNRQREEEGRKAGKLGRRGFTSYGIVGSKIEIHTQTNQLIHLPQNPVLLIPLQTYHPIQSQRALPTYLPTRVS